MVSEMEDLTSVGRGLMIEFLRSQPGCEMKQLVRSTVREGWLVCWMRRSFKSHDLITATLVVISGYEQRSDSAWLCLLIFKNEDGHDDTMVVSGGSISVIFHSGMKIEYCWE